MIRRARLAQGSWNRKAPRKESPKRDMYETRVARERAAQDREDALTSGCEYVRWLKAWWKLNGCAACGRHRGVVLHHTKHRSQKGRAEWQVPLCPVPCHIEDGPGIEGKAKRDYGVDLYARAAELAEAATLQGYLPVEMCERPGCGKWHSRKFLLDELDQETGCVRRVCESCAPEGPR
jgi:hypothetical protein